MTVVQVSGFHSLKEIDILPQWILLSWILVQQWCLQGKGKKVKGTLKRKNHLYIFEAISMLGSRAAWIWWQTDDREKILNFLSLNNSSYRSGAFLLKDLWGLSKWILYWMFSKIALTLMWYSFEIRGIFKIYMKTYILSINSSTRSLKYELNQTRVIRTTLGQR